MKHLWLFVLLVVVACNRSPQSPNPEAQVAENTAPSQSVTLLPTFTVIPSPAYTATPLPTNTPTNTPLPPTLMPTPTLTPTPKPVTHANIGWEGGDAESRTPFPDELRIKSEILVQYQSGQIFNGIEEGDIKIVWYTADDGITYWQPYLILNNSYANNDSFLFIFPLTTGTNAGHLSNPSLPPYYLRALNISAMERLGYIDHITDIQLAWDGNHEKPVLVIEKNGARLWYPDELNSILISYDEDISSFGLPPKPEPASDFVVVMHAEHMHDVYLFKYDETETVFAGISEPNAGPVYELKNNQWHSVNNPEFIGGGSPQIAYIGYDQDGNGHLYIEELTNTQTNIAVQSNVHIPLAPAAIVFDAAVSNINSFDYYFSLTSPVWSPDGRHVAFLAEENKMPFLAVYDVDEQIWQSLVQLPMNPELFFSPIWSPDGDWLVYGYRFTGENSGRLMTVSYPDGDTYEIDRGGEANWVQDTDGLRLIYRKSQEELISVNPDGSDVEVIPIDYKRPEGSNERILEYLSENNAFLIYRYDEEDGMAKLLQVPIDGSEENLLVQFPQQYETYSLFIPTWPYSAISPDGTWFWCLATSPNGQGGVYVLNLETQDSWINETAWFVTGWTPDSKGIITSGVSIYDIVTNELIYYVHRSSETLRSTNTWQNINVLKWRIQP